MSHLPNNDLRSTAKAYQRDKNHTTKWARGSHPTTHHCTHIESLSDQSCLECPARPNHRDMARRCGGKNYIKLRAHQDKKLSGQAATMARKAFRNEVVDATDGPLAFVSDNSSGDEDVRDGCAAPLPVEADFMYSYDSPSGPANGADVLSHAITQAVRRFENYETEKLVNNEYDVVDGKDMIEGYIADGDEHDYELIDHSHLK